MPEGLSPIRMALLVLYATSQTERDGHGVQGVNAYAIERLIRSRLGGVRGYGKSAVYANSDQLVELGYLEGIVIGEGARAVTVYVVTEKGADAIREWMTTPTERPHLDSELFLRTRALDLVPAKDAMASWAALRPQLTRWLLELEDAKAKATQPTLGVTLEFEYFELVIRAHLAWLDRAEKALRKQAR